MFTVVPVIVKVPEFTKIPPPAAFVVLFVILPPVIVIVVSEPVR